MQDPVPLTAAELAELESVADQTKRGLLLMAMVSDRLQNPPPVVVGGFALEFYSTGGYSTSDIDLAYINPSRIGGILEAAGFKKINRHWVSQRFDLQVEVPSHAVEAQEYQRLVRVDIGERAVHLIGVEDLILDRLGAAVHGGSTDDLHWAAELLALYRGVDGFDMAYLEQQASLERLSEALDDARRRAEESAAPD